MTTKVSAAMQDAGAIVQVVNVQTGAVATGTTQVPHDNTIPQITEGDEYMTLAITPTNALNILYIEVVTQAYNNTAAAIVATCLFVGTTANGLAVTTNRSSVANYGGGATLNHKFVAGVATELTFRVRIGASVASTTTLNGYSAAARYGGTYASSITITEIAV